MVFKATVRAGQSNVEGIVSSIRMATVKTMRETQEPMKNDVKAELSRPKSGPVVTRYSPRRQVRVSVPGEPPAEDLGQLIRSIDTDIDSDRNSVAIRLIASARHAGFLEVGTSKMLPRPFLRPTMRRFEDKVVDDLIREIKGAL